jgi:hypothetical protein
MSREVLTLPRQPVTPVKQAAGRGAVYVSNASGNYNLSTAALENSNVFTVSLWLKFKTLTSANPVILQSNSGRFKVEGRWNGQQVRASVANTSGTNRGRFDTAGVVIDQWQHFFMSANIGAGSEVVHQVLDGVSSPGSSSLFSDTGIGQFNDSVWVFGNIANNDLEIADLWLACVFIDPTLDDNLLKFRSADGKRVNLGAEGQFPLDGKEAPYFYFSGDVSSFMTNKGAGPDFVNNSMSPDITNAADEP